MTLTELIEAVKEEGLTKTQLEQYHTEITYLDQDSFVHNLLT